MATTGSPPLGIGGDERLGGEVVERARDAAACLVEERGGVVGEERVVSAGEREVVAEIGGGLFGAHAGELVAEGEPLVEGGEAAEPEPFPEGWLAEQDAGERALAVHLGVGEEPDLFELGGGEQVR